MSGGHQIYTLQDGDCCNLVLGLQSTIETTDSGCSYSYVALKMCIDMINSFISSFARHA